MPAARRPMAVFNQMTANPSSATSRVFTSESLADGRCAVDAFDWCASADAWATVGLHSELTPTPGNTAAVAC